MTALSSKAADRRYAVASPDISDLEVEYSSRAVRSTWISSQGEFLDRFETDFAAACGVPHTMAVANGTVALHLALLALGIGPGDEVIVPSLTYIATANAVLYTGATPVFADVRCDTWCLDAAHVKELIGPRTSAIIAVHLYGHPADMVALRAIADRHGLGLIEDAAEAPFATLDGRATGSLGDVATFSFFGNKILSCGEGGAVTTGDAALAARIRLLRGQGMDPRRRYFFPVVGYNYRLTNVAAAILCAQMERRDELLARRHALYREYDAEFGRDDRVELQVVDTRAVRSPWLYTMLVAPDAGVTRDDVTDALSILGVETRPMFIPLHTLPPYAHLSTPPLPVTLNLAERGFSLPTSSTLDPEDAREVAARVRQALGS